MNSSRSEQKSSRPRRSSQSVAAAVDRFDDSYRRLGATLGAPLPPDLSRTELLVLEHVADGEGAALGWLAIHLELPKSTTSVLVKGLEGRRFLRRRRRADDERRLSITLTPKGRRRVLAARALDATRLEAALRALPRPDRIAAVAGMERLAAVAAGNTGR